MGKRVLVLEPSSTEALRARLVLEREGWEVVLAKDGKQGLEMAQGLAEAGTATPDVILVETILPRMSGYEVWERLKSDPATAGIPVLLLTTEQGPVGLMPGQELGADNFLGKPYQPALLVDKLHRLSDARTPAELGAASTALQAKSDFLAMMSHELRTPLHECLGMTELALASDLTQEQRDYLTRARWSAQSLLSSVDSMIEFSELQSGQLRLQEADFALWGVVKEAVEMMKPRAEEKGLELCYLISPTVPQDVIADARRLRQVLARLIDNAIKFTEQGQVQVQLQDKRLADGKVELRFSVRDTGMGIAPDKLETIFQPFQQADVSTTRRFGGIGLGLALSRELVGLMQGRIWAESQVGAGSTLHFTVQARCVEAIAAAASPMPVAQGAAPGVSPGSTGVAQEELLHLRVLLAEDSATNQLLATANLKKAGHSVVVAKNGRLAVEAYERGGLDLILMDVAMPEMDGLEATRCIREIEQRTGASHIPIIAMTAFAMNEYREKCHGAGMDGYVIKPVAADELHRTIAPFLSARREVAVSQVAQIPPVDLAIAYDLVGEDMDLLGAIVEVSLEECPRLMEKLRESIGRAEAGTVEHAAHTLKGTVANIGAGPTRELFQSLETMGAEGNLAGAPGVLARAEGEMHRLMDFFADPDWIRGVPVKERVNG